MRQSIHRWWIGDSDKGVHAQLPVRRILRSESVSFSQVHVNEVCYRRGVVLLTYKRREIQERARSEHGKEGIGDAGTVGGTLKMRGSAFSLFSEWGQSRVGVQWLVLDVGLVEIQGLVGVVGVQLQPLQFHDGIPFLNGTVDSVTAVELLLREECPNPLARRVLAVQRRACSEHKARSKSEHGPYEAGASQKLGLRPWRWRSDSGA